MKISINIKTDKKELTLIYIMTTEGAYCAIDGANLYYERDGWWCYNCSKYVYPD